MKKKNVLILIIFILLFISLFIFTYFFIISSKPISGQIFDAITKKPISGIKTRLEISIYPLCISPGGCSSRVISKEVITGKDGKFFFNRNFIFKGHTDIDYFLKINMEGTRPYIAYENFSRIVPINNRNDELARKNQNIINSFYYENTKYEGLRYNANKDSYFEIRLIPLENKMSLENCSAILDYPERLRCFRHVSVIDGENINNLSLSRSTDYDYFLFRLYLYQVFNLCKNDLTPYEDFICKTVNAVESNNISLCDGSQYIADIKLCQFYFAVTLKNKAICQNLDRLTPNEERDIGYIYPANQQNCEAIFKNIKID